MPNYTETETRILEEISQRFGRRLAAEALRLGAVKLQPKDPFTWASGYRMPLYNDNRQFLRESRLRKLIAEAFLLMLHQLRLTPDRIAGTATAGIPHATTLADAAGLPLLYVRSAGKKHGMRNSIEGVVQGADLSGETVLLIEDLISTGGSSVRAVHALQEIGASVPWCFSIFTYGLAAADDTFSELVLPCRYASIITYDILMEEAIDEGCITRDELQDLQAWRTAPMSWGEERGFPRIRKEDD